MAYFRQQSNVQVGSLDTVFSNLDQMFAILPTTGHAPAVD